MRKFPAVGELFEQRYLLLEVLGSGGGGTVFKARQVDINRLLALKVLHPEVIDSEFKQRFFREAQALNKLCHENIVAVYHLGLAEDSLPYIAMELVSGLCLRKSMEEAESLSARSIFRIGIQLCDALKFMHNAGIIHRDIKPENIMLLQKPELDTVKIIDFGLAGLEKGSDQKLTATGLLMGSVNYISPEQCKGQKADARSDIYALAVCMYEMLAGEPPFTADSPIGLIYKKTNQEPPDLTLPTGKLVHPAIQEFVKKGLERDPEMRYQSAVEMKKALCDLAVHFDGDASASELNVKLVTRPLYKLVLLCTLLICVTGLLWFQNQRQKHSKFVSKDLVAAKNLRLDKYEAEYRSSLARSVRALGPQHPKALEDLDKLANYLCLKRSKYKEAEALYRRSLQIREKLLGPEVASLSRILDALAICVRGQGREAEAILLLKRSLKIRESAIGRNHPDVALTLDKLGSIYYDKKEYAEAGLLFERSLHIRERSLGPRDTAVADSLITYANVLRKTNQAALATALEARARAIRNAESGKADWYLSR